MVVEAVFQRQLECAESLHLADDKQIIVEKRVDDGVPGAVEGRADVVRHDVAEIDARDRPMMIGKRHSPSDATFNDAQIGETWIGQQNVIKLLEGHTSVSLLVAPLFRSCVQEHGKEATLRLNLDDVVDADGVCFPSLSTCRSNHFDIRVLNDRRVNIIGMSGGDIVDTLVELCHRHGVASFRYKSRNIPQELGFCRSAAVIVEEVKHPLVMSGIVRQHVKPGSAKMRLEARVVVEDVIVNLSSTIGLGKMYQPITQPSGLLIENGLTYGA